MSGRANEVDTGTHQLNRGLDGFDLAFILIYLVYLSFRIYGLRHDDAWAKDFSTDVLAIGRPISWSGRHSLLRKVVTRRRGHVPKTSVCNAQQ